MTKTPSGVRWSRALAKDSSVNRKDSSRRFDVLLTSVSESVTANKMRSYRSVEFRRNARPSVMTADTRASAYGWSGCCARPIAWIPGSISTASTALTPCASATETSVPEPAPMIRAFAKVRPGNHR